MTIPINKIFDVDDEAVLRIEDIAAMIGMTEETVREWCRAGKLESYKFGRRYIVVGNDFKEFMKLVKVKPQWQQMTEQ